MFKHNRKTTRTFYIGLSSRWRWFSFWLLAAPLLFLPVLVEASPLPSEKPYLLPYVGEMQTHKTRYEDTLVQIARDHDLGFNELRAANPGVDPWLPGKGVKLTLPTRHLLPRAPHEGIVINLPEMRLFYYENPYRAPITHPLGVGREGLSTPSGTTTVIRKQEKPDWRPTARMRTDNPDLPSVVPPGTANPLGTHILYLGWPEYGIHGTNKPFGIGRRVSSGCIRLYPEDIKTFFEQVPVGTKVRVVNQPVKAAWIDDAFYIEAHPTLDQADDVEQNGGPPDYVFTQDEMNAVLEAAGPDAVDRLDWAAVRDVIRARAGYPVKVAVKKQEKSDNAAQEKRGENAL
ncbi:MAG: L,D-transpeptidase family protein [Alphaproteobacteria bacterium]|nr:L,D-transpeptidase family protein [Alphaproteobacteria bacterium]